MALYFECRINKNALFFIFHSQENTAEGETSYKPSFLSEDEMKFLVDQSGFLMVLSCDQAHILHVSDSISNSTAHEPVRDDTFQFENSNNNKADVYGRLFGTREYYEY